MGIYNENLKLQLEFHLGSVRAKVFEDLYCIGHLLIVRVGRQTWGHQTHLDKYFSTNKILTKTITYCRLF